MTDETANILKEDYDTLLIRSREQANIIRRLMKDKDRIARQLEQAEQALRDRYRQIVQVEQERDEALKLLESETFK
jgi:hypothetical protein